ncbi:site-specific DNA-methyltransferase [Clostridioides sp. ES-S-0049-02]|uniref:DNA-methyltransferase n=1 Tax=Clostridioides sp. ES-S-0049-02 TaxID=2770778 RepID=UPI001D12B7A2|nr:site-specific DNA-methyltransferase [Clostridioides sp. ES-S-0049-02]
MGDFIKTDNYELYNYDCIEMMDLLITEGRQVDLTVTSPPYDNLRTYDNCLVWNFDVFKKVADRLYNITKDGGVVVWVVGDKTKNGSESGTSFKQALYFKEIGFNLHDTMIYEKKNPFGTAGKGHKRYRQSFEYMFVLSKGKVKTFNPIKEPCKHSGEYAAFTTRKNRQSDGLEFDAIRNRSMNVGKSKYLKNIWEYDVGYNRTTKDKFAFKHPAIFPEKLAQDHILSWSNEGDTVFDCFMGANTTGKIALLNNRKFIGIEKVKYYFEISKQRIS